MRTNRSTSRVLLDSVCQFNCFRVHSECSRTAVSAAATQARQTSAPEVLRARIARRRWLAHRLGLHWRGLLDWLCLLDRLRIGLWRRLGVELEFLHEAIEIINAVTAAIAALWKSEMNGRAQITSAHTSTLATSSRSLQFCQHILQAFYKLVSQF